MASTMPADRRVGRTGALRRGGAVSSATRTSGHASIAAGGGCPGRRPEGLVDAALPEGNALATWLAHARHMEAASVLAFEALRAELAARGAPASLVHRAEQARADEIRHARICERLARKHGAVDGEWAAPPRVEQRGQRSLLMIALENVVEGCVNETFAALLATWQGEHAHDRVVRAAMHAIAEDESRHSALAWSVAEWMLPRLDAHDRDTVHAAFASALARLESESLTDPHRELVAEGIVPTKHETRGLVAALASSLRREMSQIAAAA